MTYRDMEASTQINHESTADKVILIYDWSMPENEYSALLNVIGKMPGVRSVSISLYWLQMGYKVDKLQPGKKDGMQTFWNKFCESVGAYHGDYPEIFANRHLLFQFERIKQEMVSASAYAGFFTALLELLKPSLILFAHEAFTIERTLVRVARNRKIPTASLVHGGLGHKYGYRGLSGDVDLIWVWNEFALECMEYFHVDRTRLQKIGNIRHERKYLEYTVNSGISEPIKKKKAKRDIGLDENKPVITLLTAAINTGFAAVCANPRIHRDTIKCYLTLVESRPDLQFVIKAHPGYDYNELYRNMLNSRLPNLMFNEQLTLQVVLDASDVCFIMNYCSTAALEAMLQHVPVLYLDNAIYPLPDWQDGLSHTGIQRVATMRELEAAIDDLLRNRISRKKALAEADKCLRMSFGIEERSASERLDFAIRRMLDSHEVGKASGLTDAMAWHEFLYSNNAKTAQYRIDLASKHNTNVLLYVLASLSGVCNINVACLFRIFEIFDTTRKDADSATWDDRRWHLLQAHVEGYNYRSERGRSLNGIRILGIYFTHPKRFISADSQFKISIGKYLINQIVGRKALSLVRHIYLQSKH